MKKTKNILVGLLLIAVGVILGGNALGLFNVDLFFDGWWTLFIIIPSFIGLITDNHKRGSLIWLVVGILLLLACQDVIDFDTLWELMVPIIIIIIGLSLIFKDTISKEVNEKVKELNNKLNKDDEYCSTFSGQEINITDEFKGTTATAVFGGITLDLTKAVINSDVIVNTSCIFGGIDIIIPENVNIKVKSSSIFGGVSNKKNNNSNDNKYTIYVNASCVFGGVEIK